MTIWKKLLLLLPSRRRAEERDMREELESLRDMAQPHELGNLTLAAEDARATWTWTWLEQLGQDLRYARRSMLHDKTFTALAALSLALGIGANTAISSFTESILLRSLPVSEPEALVIMKWRARSSYTSAASSGMSFSTGGSYSDPTEGYIGSQFSYPALEIFQRNTDVLSSAFCYFVADRLHLTIDDATEVVRGQYVSGSYFSGMGVPPAAGRLILAGDDEEGAASVAILSHRFSQLRFGDARQAVGRTVRINDKPFSVVGVTPPGFFGAEPGSVPDVYRSDACPGGYRVRRGDDQHTEPQSPQSELLLDRDHGSARARREPRAGTGRARATVSKIRRRDCDNGTAAHESPGSEDHRRLGGSR